MKPLLVALAFFAPIPQTPGHGACVGQAWIALPQGVTPRATALSSKPSISAKPAAPCAAQPAAAEG